MKNIFLNSKLIFAFLTFIIALAGCDSSDPLPSTDGGDFDIFVPLTGAGADASGLLAFNNKTNKIDKPALQPVVWTSIPAANTRFVFEYGGDLQQKFWGRCEDASLLAVPFPEKPNPSTEFEYNIPPHIDIAAEGHHAVYFVRIKNDDRLKRDPYMILFNCAEWKMTSINLKERLAGFFSEISANYYEVYGDYSLISPNGNEIYFTVKGTFYQDATAITTLHAIMKYDKAKDEFKALVRPGLPELILTGINHVANPELIYKLKSSSIEKYYLYKINTNEFFETTFNENYYGSPKQFFIGRDQIVCFTDKGIELVFPATGTAPRTVITYENIEKIFGERETTNLKELNKRISVSNDGNIITFAYPLKKKPGTYNIASVRRDGSQLTSKFSVTSPGCPVITNVR